MPLDASAARIRHEGYRRRRWSPYDISIKRNTEYFLQYNIYKKEVKKKWLKISKN